MNQPRPVSESPPAPLPDAVRWFTQEVQPHGAALKAYLRSAYPAVRDADDVVQESYLRVWKACALHPIVSAKAFLFTVARRLAIDALRHDHRVSIISVGGPALLDVLDDGPSVQDAISQQEKVDLLVAAVNGLPARCRDVVILHKFQFLTAREVAARLGISEKGVEIQLQRGLRRVREHLRRRGIVRLMDLEN